MAPIIRMDHVSKRFKTKTLSVNALSDICIDIEEGDVYGIIGMSGAGKSTLVRCLNFLEKPTSGTVWIEGKDLSDMTNRDLRKLRMKVSMIFQHFNLLMQKNVVENICFPLTIDGVKKKEARKRAYELLDIVGMTDKANAYPAQLSGGQKQRVAIARALANNPKILLCDEATSALDPQTTKSILALLKDINRRYGITIVIITHEMSVVQEICSHVAIIDEGNLAECGKVTDIFSMPKTDAAKKLVIGGTGSVSFALDNRCVRIVFSENSSFEPVIADMVLKFKKPVNILYADTKNINGVANGEMLLQLPEEKEIADRMMEHLRKNKLFVEEKVWEEGGFDHV